MDLRSLAVAGIVVAMFLFNSMDAQSTLHETNSRGLIAEATPVQTQIKTGSKSHQGRGFSTFSSLLLKVNGAMDLYGPLGYTIHLAKHVIINQCPIFKRKRRMMLHLHPYWHQPSNQIVYCRQNHIKSSVNSSSIQLNICTLYLKLMQLQMYSQSKQF